MLRCPQCIKKDRSMERSFFLLLNFLEDFSLSSVLVELLKLELALYLLLILARKDDQVGRLRSHLN